MKKPRLPQLLLLLVCLGAAPASHAQLGDLLKKLAPTGAGRPQAPDQAASAGQLETQSLITRKSPQEIELELAPDRQCNRPQERFNIAEKLVEFGGAEAALRLHRLIESDFKFDDISPEDRRMLRYLAQTTVWLPVEVETKLGALFDLASSASGGGDQELTPLEKDSLEEVQAHTAKFRALTTDFPGDISLKLNPELGDGAFAKFGGRIQLSRNMLQTMSERPAGADLLLAHEMAHVYKRHAIKHLQFSLLSSREGWELGKKVLQRAQRGTQVDIFRDGLFTLTVVPQLISFVRGLQLKFNQEQELEADACAALWLRAAQQDPARAWREYREAFAASLGSAGPESYASSHPTTEQRESNFVRRLNAGAPITAAGTARNKLADTQSSGGRTRAGGNQPASPPAPRGGGTR